MLRRAFMMKTSVMVAAAGISLAACTTTPPAASQSGQLGKRQEINSGVDSTLARLYTAAPGSRELVAKARGVLVFPSVVAAGFVVGGQYGEGALRVGGATENYYKTLSASVGLQIGAQSKALIFLFMTQEALDRFRNSKGWAVGADASVAVLKIGANGNVDTNSVRAPVQAFVLTNAGLMANLTLEGTKVSPLGE
ncbi:BPSL1445 family SYLF domain-containing lipoprotein [Chitinasiproducens palmae]|uniref:Lipid-binding SYLF domain-containing protein n=1 Tax=Chitinasiproducens palmae TaxID=1770053 RepID=A0A1H2PWM3_9BURK|nr:YSC84-related protein [Chitinasiproducens palmae]SDV51442.1 Lipid-binding SYLF domain-containing protein [Chitinasiproducens palmae]